MPRPTPARVLYLIVGLVLGLALAVGVQIYVLPALSSAVPFLAASPTPIVPSGPIQFTAASLERVMPLNVSLERGGAILRLNALELYRDGLTVSYTLLSRRTVSPPTLEPEVFQLTDDRGTSYTFSSLGSATVLSAGLTTGMASFTPGPPADARALRLVVPNVLAVGLRVREGQARVTPGPWEFNLPLS